MTRFSRSSELICRFFTCSTSDWNFCGVSLFRMPRTRRVLTSASATSAAASPGVLWVGFQAFWAACSFTSWFRELDRVITFLGLSPPRPGWLCRRPTPPPPPGGGRATPFRA
ncbi:unnamed protein product [Ixodes pacificus]